MIFLSTYLIKQFINNLTIDSGIKFAKKYNLIFSLEEAKIIVPFLKQNVNLINKDNKDKLLALIKLKVNSLTYSKIVSLVNKLI